MAALDQDRRKAWTQDERDWPSAEVKAEWQRKWKSKNYKSDAAVVREAKDAGYTERMVRRFGKSGRT